MKEKLVAKTKPETASPSKMVTIKSGPYAGKNVILFGGEFRDVTGKSVFKTRTPAAFDYMKRMVMEGFGPSDKVYLGTFPDDGDEVIINENELKSKEAEKETK